MLPTEVTKSMDADPPKPGAPVGNKNRQRHGLRGPLTLGSLAREHAYVRRWAGAFNSTALEAAHAKHGSLDLTKQAWVNTATRNEIRAQLATRWLRQGGDSLPLAERLALLKTITDASEARDRALDKLKLGESDGDMFDAVWREAVLERPTITTMPQDAKQATEDTNGA